MTADPAAAPDVRRSAEWIAQALRRTGLPTVGSVHDQRPDEVVEAVRQWIASNVPAGIASTVTFSGPGVRPCLTPLDDPALRAAAAAMERAFGTEVLYTREGGSGPEADLAAILAAPVVFLGVMLPGDRIHSPNERVSLPMLLGGARAAAYLWESLPEALG